MQSKRLIPKKIIAEVVLPGLGKNASVPMYQGSSKTDLTEVRLGATLEKNNICIVLYSPKPIYHTNVPACAIILHYSPEKERQDPRCSLYNLVSDLSLEYGLDSAADTKIFVVSHSQNDSNSDVKKVVAMLESIEPRFQFIELDCETRKKSIKKDKITSMQLDSFILNENGMPVTRNGLNVQNLSSIKSSSGNENLLTRLTGLIK